MEINKKKIKNFSSPYIIAEIGINHNGSIDLAKTLIEIAKNCGCNAVKFQKRDIDVVYTKEELSRERKSIYGTTNGDLKRGLEFSEKEYCELFKYAAEKEIDCFASPWDCNSVDFLEKFNPCCYKIASASLTDIKLLDKIAKTEKPVILSVGMSTVDEIDIALQHLNKENLAILSCTSTYPTPDEEVNLNCIKTLMQKYPDIPVGYSGHESDILPSIIACSLGAAIIERHVTVSKDIWGSDQKSSLEPRELKELVHNIKRVTTLLGDGKIKVFSGEIPIRDKLRRY